MGRFLTGPAGVLQDITGNGVNIIAQQVSKFTIEFCFGYKKFLIIGSTPPWNVTTTAPPSNATCQNGGTPVGFGYCICPSNCTGILCEFCWTPFWNTTTPQQWNTTTPQQWNASTTSFLNASTPYSNATTTPSTPFNNTTPSGPCLNGGTYISGVNACMCTLSCFGQYCQYCQQNFTTSGPTWNVSTTPSPPFNFTTSSWNVSTIAWNVSTTIWNVTTTAWNNNSRCQNGGTPVGPGYCICPTYCTGFRCEYCLVSTTPSWSNGSTTNFQNFTLNSTTPSWNWNVSTATPTSFNNSTTSRWWWHGNSTVTPTSWSNSSQNANAAEKPISKNFFQNLSLFYCHFLL